MSAILIIDDEAAIRALLRQHLEKAGHQVTEGADGEEALRLVKSQKPDLVFLDVMLPRRDGWKVCRDVKGNPETAKTPIVLLTSCRENVDEIRGWESGADGYLTKPWNPDQLREIAQQLLQRQAPPR